ncbi:MAG TPA: hypothetical protein VGT03_10705 [Candidatus Acidoferrales bacterium]|nr:hypothetical protein [Candidatus Acidoferrales bacterium]
MITWELLKLGATRTKKGFGARVVAARDVVERCGELDEALQK